MVKCEANDLQYVLDTELKDRKIISIVPFALQSQVGAFHSTLQSLIVSTYIICLAMEEDEIKST